LEGKRLEGVLKKTQGDATRKKGVADLDLAKKLHNERDLEKEVSGNKGRSEKKCVRENNVGQRRKTPRVKKKKKVQVQKGREDGAGLSRVLQAGKKKMLEETEMAKKAKRSRKGAATTRKGKLG